MHSQLERYRELQITYGFTDAEIRYLQYGRSILICEGTKFILLGIILGLLGHFQEYVIVMITLLPLRIFSGGIHFNHYFSCLLFTACFIVCPILLQSAISIPDTAQLPLLFLCLIATAFAGPVPSKKRPPLSHRRYCSFRRITCGLLLIYIILFGFVRSFPGESLCLWVILLQTIQLLCAKGARKGELDEKTDSRSTI